MTVWMVRAGKHGEFEHKFLQENRIYVTWDHLAVDIGKMTDRNQLFQAMSTTYPDAKVKAIHNNVSQVWPFAHDMALGDLIILRRRSQHGETGEHDGGSGYGDAEARVHWAEPVRILHPTGDPVAAGTGRPARSASRACWTKSWVGAGRSTPRWRKRSSMRPV